MRPNILKLLAEKQGLSTFDTKSSPDDMGPSADYFGETATDFGNSQYDEQTSTALLTQKNELSYLRGERQTNWDKLGNGLVNMAGKTFTTAAEGIVNPFYGTIAALTHTNAKGEWDPSANAYYNNDLTKSLDNVNKFLEETNPTYETKAEATATGLGKLWSFNTISRDILGGAGTTIGAAITGAAWSKGMSLVGKALGAAGSAEEAATIIAEAAESGIAASADKLKYVSDQALKKTIKDGARQGTIAITSASGESGAEAREAEKNVYYKLTHDDFGNEKRMSEGELEYAKMMSQQAGDAAFAMNLPVIMADNWITFGKALFGNKTNDFAKIIKEGAILDDVTKTYKAVEKGKYANLGYRASKIGGTMASEGTQEQLQFAIGKTVEDYYKKKYYNPNAADFADSMTKGLAEAYGTQEGWHSAIIGALSAGIAGPGIVLASKGAKGFKDEYITNPEDAIIAKGVQSLNEYNADVVRKKFVDNYVRSANLTEDKDEALANNNDFDYHNANEDMIFSYIYNRMQNGKLEDVKKELDAFKDLTVEELEANYGIKINVDNKSKVDELTSTNAVKKFVESRMEKITAIEDTYNAVTKLFPSANPDVKELLMYSAQGLESSKKRSKELGESVSKILLGESDLGMQQLSTVIPGMLITPATFAKDFVKMSKEQKTNILNYIESSDEISPLNKQDISNKLKDLESLKERENDFVAAYNALKNPEVQNEFLKQSETLWGKYSKIEETKKAQEAAAQQAANQPAAQPPVNPNNPVNPVNPQAPVNPTNQPGAVNPYAQWYTDNNLNYNSSEEEITNSLQDNVDNGILSNEQAAEIFSDWNNNKGTQPAVSQQPTSIEGKPQSVLRTETKNRDSNVTQFEGKSIFLGELRAKFGLISFAEVQELLKDLTNKGLDINKHIKFTVTANNKVTLNIVDTDGNYYPVSIIEEFGLFKDKSSLTPDQIEQDKRFQEVIDLFYNENGPKTVQEINELHDKGVIKVNLKEFLNYTISNVDGNGDFIDPLMEFDYLDYLLDENGNPNYIVKDGARELSDDVQGDFTAFEEINNEITDGYHLLVEGLQQPIKLRLAQNKEAGALLEQLGKDIKEAIDANASTADIQDLVKKFNEQVFFALKPKGKTSVGINLRFDEANGLHLRKSVLSKEDPNGERKTNAILDKKEFDAINNSSLDIDQKTEKIAELSKKGTMPSLTNINPEDLSLDFLIEQINNSNLTSGARPFKAEDIKYNSPFNDSKQLETSRFEAPIGVEGIKKYNIEISANIPITPVQQTPAQTSTTTTPTDLEAQKADIENTLYRTISGSRPLSEMIEDGMYIDLGNNMFAYVGKNGIAAIVNKDITDNKGNYSASKSFWNTKEKRWVLPNLSNLKDDAKVYKLDEKSYIEKFEKATDKLNTELKALEGITKTNEEKIADLRADEQAEYDAMSDPNDTAKKQEIWNRYNDLITNLSEANKPFTGKQVELKDVLIDKNGEKYTVTSLSIVGKNKKIHYVRESGGGGAWDSRNFENFISTGSLEYYTEESIDDPLNVQRGKQDDDDDVFSVGDEESTGITQEEINSIKAILPKFISIDDIKTIARNLKVNGIPYGVFKNKVIYLNTAKGKPGTAYHEAFHAVFRTMLTDEQIDKYLKAAQKDFIKSGKNMEQEINNLILKVPAYINKTKNELTELVLEEHLADKFSEVAQKPMSQIKESDNYFKQLWFKIKEFFKNLTNFNDLDILFSNILKGSFVNSSEIGNRFSNSTDSVFKLLPRFVGGYFSAEQSRKFVNTFAAKLYKIKIGDIKDIEYYNVQEINGNQIKTLKSDENLLELLVAERLDELNNAGVAYIKSQFPNAQSDNYKLALSKLNDERRLLLDTEKAYNGESGIDILKSAVLGKLNTFNFETTEDDQEKQEYKDKFSSQEAWLSGGHDSLSKVIKSYIGFSTMPEVDEITGLVREVAVDEVAVYNGLIRLLADTNKEDMIAKLHYSTRGNDNPNVKSFYEQVLKDLEIAYDPETNSVVLPKNQNKINVYNAILTAFDKSNIQMINAFQKENFKGDVEGFGWMKANTRDTGKITLDRWASKLLFLSKNGLNIKKLAAIEKQLDAIAKKYYSAEKIKDISEDVQSVQDLFNQFGVSLTKPYIEYSLLKQKESFEEVNQTQKYFTKDQLNILKLNEEVVPISWALFEPTGGFSLSKSVDGNILNLYKGKKVDNELTVIAENNAIFDETTANFSFTNAEGERVYEIISKSAVIAAIIKFNTTNFAESITGRIKRDEKGRILRDDKGMLIFEEGTATANSSDTIESKNIEFLKSNWLLNKYSELFNKGRKAGIKLNMLSGFVDTTFNQGKTKGGIVFGKFDQRTYLLSDLALFYNNGKNSNTARYQFRQNESSGTSYVVELPKINIQGKNFTTVGNFFVNQFTTEYNRIKREAQEFKKNGPGNIKTYNTSLSDRAFDFTEFQYLQDLLDPKGATGSMVIYNQIKNAAIDGQELSDDHLQKVLSAIGITGNEILDKKGNTTTMYTPTGHGLLGINFAEFKKDCERNRIKDFLPADLKDNNGSVDNFLYEFYINDYMMSLSFNELLDGDYALGTKSKDEISKRHKGGIASGNSYGKGKHNSSIIKGIKGKITTKTIDGKLLTITNEDVVVKYYDENSKEVSGDDNFKTKKSFAVINNTEYELADYEPNDAQSYASQYHMMMGALRQGRLDETTREIYKQLIQFTRKDANGNVVKKINVGDKNVPGFDNFSIQHLFNTMSSFNSKKTVVFDGLKGQYLKMSEIAIVRSSVSYVEDYNVDKFVDLTNRLFDHIFQDDFESASYRSLVREISKLYEPIPGMEYFHNLANQQDLHEIDHTAVDSASKKATYVGQDSESPDFDLSKSRFEVINENKRNQVETPTGKSEVTVGSQILGIITSEQDDTKTVNFQGKLIKIGKLKEIYYSSINTTRDVAFKNAIKIIKDVKGEILEYGKNNPGTIDITKLDEYVKRAILNSGADASLTEFFDTPYNYNMVQKLVKAEQVVLAHFSKGVLAQKTNGDKVSLVSGIGFKLVRDLSTGEIISHHQVVKDPAKYADKSKYSTDSRLQYNAKDPVTGELYSECALSQQILTRHGLKIGDKITPEMTEVMRSLGYRIPTGDKQSAISLRVVSLLPDYYNGSGIFPDELVYLSGADFDIDSEFIQMPYFWYKKSSPTVPIKYGIDLNNDDKWEAYKFYNLNYNKDFVRIYKDAVKTLKITNPEYLELKDSLGYYNEIIAHYKESVEDSLSKKQSLNELYALTKQLRSQIEGLENFIYQATSEELGLPKTQSDYEKSKSPSPPVDANNTGLDAMITLLSNEYVSNITNATTSTEEVIKTRDKILKEGFVKSSNTKIKSEHRVVHDIVGKFNDNVKNSEGSQGIGPIANKIQQFAFLMSKITSENREVVFDENAFAFKLADTSGGVYKALNKDGKRIADQLNMLLNMFTDNAKDPIAGTLNIKLELLGGMAEMIMQGMSFENAVKIINIPIIQEYGQLIKTLSYGKKNNIEEKFTKFGSQKEAIQRIIYGEVDPTTGKYLKEFTYDQLTELKQNKNFTNVSVSEIENILKGSESKGTQIEIFMQFLKVVDQGDLMSDVNTFLKLNQGLDISFTELHHDLHKAIDNFQIHGLVGTKDQGLATVTKPHIDIAPLLEQDVNTLENIKRALFVDKQVGQKIFIEQTQVFKFELNKLFPSLSISFRNKQDELQKLSKAFLGQVSSLGYQEWLKNLLESPETNEANKKLISQKLDALNFGLLFSSLNDESKITLAKQLEVLQSHNTTKNNYFIRYIASRFYDATAVTEKFNPKFDYIETRSFVKESDATMSLLIDSVKDLFNKKAILDDTTQLTAKQFVDNMFNYLMVKDNMQFKNNSLSKFLPVTMFGQYSKMLDKMVESFVTNSEFAENFDLAELAYNFRKIYATDVNTPFGSIKYKEIKAEYENEVVTKDKKLYFKVKGKGNEFKDSLAKMSDVFGFETAPVTVKIGGKNVVVNHPLFPQFMKFKVDGKVKIYELQTARNSDKLAGSIVGLEATYVAIENTGTKGVSLFFAGSYEKALAITEKVESTPEEAEENEVVGENISSKGSDFAKKLTNVNNKVGLTYKGGQYVNSEHAYQTWKSGEFNQTGYDLKGGKVRGGKLGDTFAIMTDILTEKLKQHPELMQGINERGGLAYIEQSTHDVIGDKFWESSGENKFIEALAKAYENVESSNIVEENILSDEEKAVSLEAEEENPNSVVVMSAEELAFLDSFDEDYEDNNEDEDEDTTACNGGMPI